MIEWDIFIVNKFVSSSVIDNNLLPLRREKKTKSVLVYKKK